MIEIGLGTTVCGFEAAIQGMRNPLESWDKSDSIFAEYMEPDDIPKIGPNDLDLMTRLAKAGSEHAKYKRMIVVYADITAPLYWWKEYDTYKVGTVANSCSTMHGIHKKNFTLDDFSCEHLGYYDYGAGQYEVVSPMEDLHLEKYTATDILEDVIHALNFYRERYLETKDKKYWWQMIQLLPSSYNQKRTVMLNYEVLTNIYRQRKEHKLDEWRAFCEWIKDLPYSESITLKED